jgi:osmotically-inducible protein OsmY
MRRRAGETSRPPLTEAQEKSMNRKWTIVSGVGLGAALMYLLDPDKGRRRRALLRDRAVHVFHKTADGLYYASRGVAQRAEALSARTRSLLTQCWVSDEVLAERVRSRIGHVVSHPGAIEVTAEDGRVILAGPILAGEVEELLTSVSRVPGVTGLENRLEVHEEAGHVPALQSGRSEVPAEASLLPH